MVTKRFAVFAVGVLAFGNATKAAEVPDWLPESNPDARYLIDMERRWVNSGCTGEDLDKQIMADGFLGTAPDGRRFRNSDEFDLDHSVHEKDCSLDDAKVRLFRPDLAVVYGSERTTRVSKEGAETVRCLIWTDTWMKRGTTWRIVAAQDTVIPCK